MGRVDKLETLPRCCRDGGSRSGLKLAVDRVRSAKLALAFCFCSAVNEGCAANGARREMPSLELKDMGSSEGRWGGRAQKLQ